MTNLEALGGDERAVRHARRDDALLQAAVDHRRRAVAAHKYRPRMTNALITKLPIQRLTD